MTEQERGYLLLCADLGTGLRPLTLTQMRTLRQRVRQTAPEAAERSLCAADLRALGYDAAQAAHILALLGQEKALDAYLTEARQHFIAPLTPVSWDYPARLRQALGDHAPQTLFYRGDVRLLRQELISLVGARELGPQGEAFAEKVGRLAAQEGYVLVSGNAPGADQTAQRACLEAGGQVIAVLPGSIPEVAPQPRTLYLCEDGWHLPFSPLRALQRNRIIHALGRRIFVAQTGCGSGGTWSGTVDALHMGLGPVFVCDDGSPGAEALAARGATLLKTEALCEICTTFPERRSLLEQEGAPGEA